MYDAINHSNQIWVYCSVIREKFILIRSLHFTWCYLSNWVSPQTYHMYPRTSLCNLYKKDAYCIRGTHVFYDLWCSKYLVKPGFIYVLFCFNPLANVTFTLTCNQPPVHYRSQNLFTIQFLVAGYVVDVITSTCTCE